ncbi:MAG: hypothetical protein GTN99_06640 [Candidatus Dadabacteria bacterium]|nr:hypothetical protein [Candidatus Dadabacteria bacterium]
MARSIKTAHNRSDLAEINDTVSTCTGWTANTNPASPDIFIPWAILNRLSIIEQNKNIKTVETQCNTILLK